MSGLRWTAALCLLLLSTTCFADDVEIAEGRLLKIARAAGVEMDRDDLTEVDRALLDHYVRNHPESVVGIPVRVVNGQTLVPTELAVSSRHTGKFSVSFFAHGDMVPARSPVGVHIANYMTVDGLSKKEALQVLEDLKAERRIRITIVRMPYLRVALGDGARKNALLVYSEDPEQFLPPRVFAKLIPPPPPPPPLVYTPTPVRPRGLEGVWCFDDDSRWLIWGIHVDEDALEISGWVVEQSSQAVTLESVKVGTWNAPQATRTKFHPTAMGTLSGKIKVDANGLVSELEFVELVDDPRDPSGSRTRTRTVLPGTFGRPSLRWPTLRFGKEPGSLARRYPLDPVSKPALFGKWYHQSHGFDATLWVYPRMGYELTSATANDLGGYLEVREHYSSGRPSFDRVPVLVHADSWWTTTDAPAIEARKFELEVPLQPSGGKTQFRGDTLRDPKVRLRVATALNGTLHGTLGGRSVAFRRVLPSEGDATAARTVEPDPAAVAGVWEGDLPDKTRMRVEIEADKRRLSGWAFRYSLEAAPAARSHTQCVDTPVSPPAGRLLSMYRVDGEVREFSVYGVPSSLEMEFEKTYRDIRFGQGVDRLDSPPRFYTVSRSDAGLEMAGTETVLRAPRAEDLGGALAGGRYEDVELLRLRRIEDREPPRPRSFGYWVCDHSPENELNRYVVVDLFVTGSDGSLLAGWIEVRAMDAAGERSRFNSDLILCEPWTMDAGDVGPAATVALRIGKLHVSLSAVGHSHQLVGHYDGVPVTMDLVQPRPSFLARMEREERIERRRKDRRNEEK